MIHYFAMSNFNLKKEAIDVLRWGIEKSFEGIEIWSDVPFMFVDDVPEDLLMKFQKASDKIKFTLHSPFYGINICSVNPGVLHESLRQIKKALCWTDYFSIERIIIHMGKTPSDKPEVMRRVREILLKSLEEIKLEAEGRGVQPAVENIGIEKADFDIVPENFKNILDSLELKMCLDTGHANINWGVEDTVREFGKYIIQIHASDNDGERDEHLPAGRGSVNWEACRDLIMNKNIPVIHEIQWHDAEEGTLSGREFIEKKFM